MLAELSRRDLVPAIWLPDPKTRAERELARWRLHLVRHRSALNNRVHAILIAFAKPCPVADLFGLGGRELLENMTLPEPWRGHVEAALRLVDHIDDQIALSEEELGADGASHPYVPLLMTVPGIGWVLAYTIAAELGDIGRYSQPQEAGWI